MLPETTSLRSHEASRFVPSVLVMLTPPGSRYTKNVRRPDFPAHPWGAGPIRNLFRRMPDPLGHYASALPGLSKRARSWCRAGGGGAPDRERERAGV
ncbi:hypothetical protein GCM10027294_27880 [Marinactinospora endophytica]